MADLFGEDFADLLVRSGDSIQLSAKAHSSLDLTLGTLYLWPTRMIEDTSELEKSKNALLEKVARLKRTKSRQSDPVAEYISEMFEAEVEQNAINFLFQYISRNTIFERLKQKGVIGDLSAAEIRVITGRISKELIEYNIIELLLPNSGPRPAIYSIKYPFDVKGTENDEVHPSPTEVDLTTYGEGLSYVEDDEFGQVIELRRSLTMKGRPHEAYTEKGEPIDYYEKEITVYDPNSGPQKVQLVAESYTAVMHKIDEYRYAILLKILEKEIRDRRRRNAPLDDWFVMTPENVMELMGATGSKNLEECRAMLIRWKDTRLTASVLQEIVGSQKDEDGNELIGYITKDSITQFSETKESWKVLRSGRKVLKALAFKLPPSVQKGLEKRAESQPDDKFAGLSEYISSKANKTLLNDSFAIQVDRFFWHMGKRYAKTKKGWHSELWKGLAEIFDFEFVVPDKNLPKKQQRAKIDANKKLFLRYLKRFFNSFSDNPERDFDTFMSYDGGTIRVRVVELQVIIELEARTKRQSQRGMVYIKPVNKALASPKKNQTKQNKSEATEDTEVVEWLMNNGIEKRIAIELSINFSSELLYKVGELTELVLNNGGIKKDAISFFLGVLKKNPTLEEVEIDIDNQLLQEPKPLTKSDARAEVTRSVMDINNTEW